MPCRVILALLLAQPLPAAERHELRYKFEPGQVLRYLVDDASTVDVTQAEASTVAKYSTRTWRHYRVKAVDTEGNATLELRIDRVHMKASGDGKTIEFDSDHPGTPPAEFAQVTSTVGRTVAEITVSPSGELSDPDQKDLQVLTVLPPEPVAVGDAWQETFEVSVVLEDSKLRRPVRMQRRYTLTSVKEGIAEIDLETIVLTPVIDPAEEAQLIQRTPSGVLRLDLDDGVIVSKSTRLDKQVVGFSGPGSKLKVLRLYSETLIDAER